MYKVPNTVFDPNFHISKFTIFSKNLSVTFCMIIAAIAFILLIYGLYVILKKGNDIIGLINCTIAAILMIFVVEIGIAKLNSYIPGNTILTNSSSLITRNGGTELYLAGKNPYYEPLEQQIKLVKATPKNIIATTSTGAAYLIVCEYVAKHKLKNPKVIVKPKNKQKTNKSVDKILHY